MKKISQQMTCSVGENNPVYVSLRGQIQRWKPQTGESISVKCMHLCVGK